MNKYDERYEIRLADRNDIDAIMHFIDKNWKRGHILSKDRGLFEYEFLEGEQVNMILAIDRNTKQMEGIFGFLYCSHTSDMKKRDLWGSLWKVADEQNNIPFLGVELAKRVYELTGCRMHIGNGANPKTTIPLRRLFFGDKTGRMKQYYRLNPQVREYRVCDIRQPREKDYKVKERLQKIIEISTMEQFCSLFDIEGMDVYPYKDNWYIEKRYFRHPYYQYKLYGLKEQQGVTAVMVCRELEVEGTRILRIIDYMGNHSIFSETGAFWDNIMRKQNYEYVDFYEFGIDDAVLEDAGFVYRDDEDENVIPNYFEPFLKENVDIWVHYKYDGTTFFKGDCDQDRPNIYRETERRMELG
jgi:hypothetical protein